MPRFETAFQVESQVTEILSTTCRHATRQSMRNISYMSQLFMNGHLLRSDMGNYMGWGTRLHGIMVKAFNTQCLGHCATYALMYTWQNVSYMHCTILNACMSVGYLKHKQCNAKCKCVKSTMSDAQRGTMLFAF